ncbi:hypothetical protein HHUSO_G31406, partial [Huso huso]
SQDLSSPTLSSPLPPTVSIPPVPPRLDLLSTRNPGLPPPQASVNSGHPPGRNPPQRPPVPPRSPALRQRRLCAADLLNRKASLPVPLEADDVQYDNRVNVLKSSLSVQEPAPSRVWTLEERSSSEEEEEEGQGGGTETNPVLAILSSLNSSNPRRNLDWSNIFRSEQRGSQNALQPPPVSHESSGQAHQSPSHPPGWTNGDAAAGGLQPTGCGKGPEHRPLRSGAGQRHPDIIHIPWTQEALREERRGGEERREGVWRGERGRGEERRGGEEKERREERGGERRSEEEGKGKRPL